MHARTYKTSAWTTLAVSLTLAGCGGGQPNPGTVLDEAMRAKRSARW